MPTLDRDWSEEDNAEFRRMWEEALPNEDFLERFAVTWYYCDKHRKELKLSPRDYSKLAIIYNKRNPPIHQRPLKFYDELRRLWAQNMPRKEIQQKLKITGNALSGMIDRYRLPKRDFEQKPAFNKPQVKESLRPSNGQSDAWMPLVGPTLPQLPCLQEPLPVYRIIDVGDD